jgi:hypothetical protein
MSNFGRCSLRNFLIFVVGAFCWLSPGSAQAQGTPYPANVDPAQFHPGYYAFFGTWDEIPLSVLVNEDFVGAKILYRWRDLEPAPNTYDFSSIEEDLAKLREAGKQLWIQIEYTQWNGAGEPKTPEYMWSDPSYGGASPYYGNYRRSIAEGGWHPMFWNGKVQSQLLALIKALGNRFSSEPNIEGIALGETSIEVADGFTCKDFLQFSKDAAIAAKSAFRSKITMQMVNFACFDLLEFMQWAENRGMGLGTPDIYVFKNFLVESVYPKMYESRNVVPMGPDVQWGNYDRNNMTVREIRDFAISAMDPWYMFWQIREPYFTDEVLPAIFSRKLPAAVRFYSSGLAGAPPSNKPKPPQLLE